MTTNSETGHAKNVANFSTLITSATALGTAYNPSKEALKPAALQSTLTAASNSLYNVNTLRTAYSNAVAAREFAFAPLSKLITRSYYALKASDTTSLVDDTAKTIVRKLQGTSARAKFTEEEKQALEAEGKSTTQISTSQMSFDLRLENFDKYIKTLASIEFYNPNEEDLKVSTLTALYNDLRTKNSEVITAAVQLSNARINRNNLLYKPLTGMVDIASDAKLYIKSVFGPSSPQYKQVSKLNFITPRQ